MIIWPVKFRHVGDLQPEVKWAASSWPGNWFCFHSYSRNGLLADPWRAYWNPFLLMGCWQCSSESWFYFGLVWDVDGLVRCQQYAENGPSVHFVRVKQFTSTQCHPKPVVGKLGGFSLQFQNLVLQCWPQIHKPLASSIGSIYTANHHFMVATNESARFKIYTNVEVS